MITYLQRLEFECSGRDTVLQAHASPECQSSNSFSYVLGSNNIKTDRYFIFKAYIIINSVLLGKKLKSDIFTLYNSTQFD